MKPSIRSITFPAVLCLSTILGAGEVLRLEIAAGSLERTDTPLQVEIGSGAKGVRLLETTGGAEKPVAAQVEAGLPGTADRVHFILAGVTAPGKVRMFRLETLDAAPQAVPGALSLQPSIQDLDGKRLEVRLAGRSVLSYNYGKVTPPDPKTPPIQIRNAYLHPLWSPGGQVLTMDFPKNHLHHRGVWFPWTKTEFEGRHPDFWNLGDGLGTVEFDRLDGTSQGPVFAGFRVRQRHMDLKAPGGPKAALKEVWDVRVYAVGGQKQGYFIFDLDSVQECAGPSPLKLEEYRYGGLGIRGSWDWEEDVLRVFTSEGKGRLNGEGSTARWFDLTGPVAGIWAGVSILGHPTNFRAPQALRIHPTEPFGNFAPVKTAPFSIEPGKPYVSRYRFYLHDGVLKADEAERLWLDYAQPPAVKVSR